MPIRRLALCDMHRTLSQAAKCALTSPDPGFLLSPSGETSGKPIRDAIRNLAETFWGTKSEHVSKRIYDRLSTNFLQRNIGLADSRKPCDSRYCIAKLQAFQSLNFFLKDFCGVAPSQPPLLRFFFGQPVDRSVASSITKFGRRGNDRGYVSSSNISLRRKREIPANGITASAVTFVSAATGGSQFYCGR